MTDEKFYDSLSDAEWDQAAAIETELEALLNEGLSEETGMRFVRTVMEARKVVPQATVEGVLEAVLLTGLDYVGDKSTLESLRSASADGVTGRTGCVVSPDVAALAKQRRKKRGVRGV